jgi:chromosome segregation ATPase
MPTAEFAMTETFEETRERLKAVLANTAQLKVLIEEARDENTSLRAKYASANTMLKDMTMVAETNRAATAAVTARADCAEGITANTHDIEVLKKDIEIQKQENKILRERFDLLSAENTQLKSKLDRLQQDVRSLQSDVSALQTVGIVREAMQTLEYFICCEAADKAGKNKSQIRKLRLSTFDRLAAQSISLQSWASAELVAMIEKYKTDSTAAVHLPCTEATLIAALNDDEDDDEEDCALKSDIVRRLSSYFEAHKVPFGTWMKK